MRFYDEYGGLPIKADHKRILIAFRNFWLQHGAGPSAVTLSRQLGLPRRTITDALISLAGKGFLKLLTGGSGKYMLQKEISYNGEITDRDSFRDVPIRFQNTSVSHRTFLLSVGLFPGAVLAVQVTSPDIPEDYISSGDILVFAYGAGRVGEPYLDFRDGREYLSIRTAEGPKDGLRLIRVITNTEVDRMPVA